MQIFLSHASLPGRGAQEILDHALEAGFDGVAISDRDPGIWDPALVKGLAARARQARLGVVVDANADLTSSEPSELGRQVEYLERLMQLCRLLSAPIMRVAIGGQSVGVQRILGRRSQMGFGSPPTLLRRALGSRVGIRCGHLWRAGRRGRPFPRREAIAIASRALESLVSVARETNVRLAVENHWGITTWPEDLVEIVDDVDSELIGTCPDFANFPAGRDCYSGIELLAPRAVIAHARSFRFSSDGQERTIDFARCIETLAQAGFDGPLSVEFMGWGDSLRGAIRTRDLIQRSLERIRGSSGE